jgi:hypothetical protein
MPRKMAREPKTIAQEFTSPTPTTPSKISLVLELLRCEQGATLAEMVDATAWLPHTTRAALTGLRKKGHNLEKGKRGDVTCYRIFETG